MHQRTEALFRAAVALQVAALEWDGEDVADNLAILGAEAALKEAAKAVKAMRRWQDS